MSPAELIQKGAEVAQRLWRSTRAHRFDLRHSTYAQTADVPSGSLYGYCLPIVLAGQTGRSEVLAALCEHYLAHRFDLLGSGWVQVRHGMTCRGLEGQVYPSQPPVRPDADGLWLEDRINQANLLESQSIWRLIGQGYTPIDWQLDFKSGYRWSEQTWHRHIRYGDQSGVDVKVPWELSRMQHLPQLAWAHSLARMGQPGFASATIYADEFRNQVLDFIATNPPRFGVNWSCPMDVAIRTANCLIAYDLFRAQGTCFDAQFNAVFLRSIYEHAAFIVENLEWLPELRANHYLANIAGLLFAAAYLPRTPETDAWLGLSVHELIKEVELQFNPDGSNFEASTSYHRLSAEIAIYATSLILGLPQEKREALGEFDATLLRLPFPLSSGPLAMHPLPGSDTCTPFSDEYWHRLEKMAEFIVHISKPNGAIPQIGDTDSGRFLKLFPSVHPLRVGEAKQRFANLKGYSELPDAALYWVEDHLDHRGTVAAINGLFGRADLAAFADRHERESVFVSTLAKGSRIASYRAAEEVSAARGRLVTKISLERLRLDLQGLPPANRQRLEIQMPGVGAFAGLETFAYPDFGVYLLRSERVYLALRCGPIGQNGFGGHAHNDQLSIELNIDGEDWILDPGSYLYTPAPRLRNRYRSVRAHFTPQVEGKEPGLLDTGLFILGNEAQAQCLFFGPEGFAGVHQGFGSPVYRIVHFLEQSLLIEDYSLTLPLLVRAPTSNEAEEDEPLLPSSGYGVRYARGFTRSERF